ncbi:MAG: nitroreductase family protein [Agriterribacter sp.]
MSIKGYASRLLPRKIRYVVLAMRSYYPNIRRFIKHSNAFYALDNQRKMIGQIVLKYHVVEKGLTMPNMKLGFGFDMLLSLIKLCNRYIDQNFDLQDKHFEHAVKILDEYLYVHKQAGFDLNPVLVTEINGLMNRIRITSSCRQIQISTNEYFKYADDNFRDFAFSRHSVRNFIDKEVEVDLIVRAIEIAQKSPSSCNRQPNRVYIVQDKEHMKWILETQRGNRGFGQMINKVIVLSSELGVFGMAEKNEAYLNSGLFAMGLLYGLHYYKIGALPLAYICFSEKDDQKLRRICNIPNSEVVTLIIGCGYPPPELSIASSPRYNPREIVSVV